MGTLSEDEGEDDEDEIDEEEEEEESVCIIKNSEQFLSRQPPYLSFEQLLQQQDVCISENAIKKYDNYKIELKKT